MRQLRKATPLVLDTQMAALTENIYIEAGDCLEQWYYANSGMYLPDRQTTPLVLQPAGSVWDVDTKRTYTVAFYAVQWSKVENGVRTIITNSTDTPEAEYVLLPGGSLRVKRNVPPGQAVGLICEAQYIDPRDNATTYPIEMMVTLATNRDATEVFETVNILTEKSLLYDPILDDSPLFSLTAQIMRANEEVTSGYTITWKKKDAMGNDVDIENDMCYVSGQNTHTLTVNALYGENIVITARVAKSGTLLPCLSTVSISWVEPKMSSTAYSPQGSALRYGGGRKTFGMIANLRGIILPEAKARENLLLEWKSRKSTANAETLLGWGQMADASSEELIGTRTGGTSLSSLASTLVWPVVYLRGAYRIVEYSSDTVTHDDKTVVFRTEENV